MQIHMQTNGVDSNFSTLDELRAPQRNNHLQLQSKKTPKSALMLVNQFLLSLANSAKRYIPLSDHLTCAN